MNIHAYENSSVITSCNTHYIFLFLSNFMQNVDQKKRKQGTTIQSANSRIKAFITSTYACNFPGIPHTIHL